MPGQPRDLSRASRGVPLRRPVADRPAGERDQPADRIGGGASARRQSHDKSDRHFGEVGLTKATSPTFDYPR